MSKPAVNGSSSLDAKEKAAIDKYKRSGGFDRARKEILQQWESSEQASAFRARLENIVKAEIARDPSLLHRDRGKAATLIAGAVERTQLYPETKKAADRFFTTEAFKSKIYKDLEAQSSQVPL